MNVSRTRSLVRIFRWDFLMGFFQGFFWGKTAQKFRRKNPHPKIRTGHHKIREKNRTQKSAQKNPREKSTPTCLCKNPKQSMSETNSSKPVPEKVVNSVPHLASDLSCLETATPVLHRPPHLNQCVLTAKTFLKICTRNRYATLCSQTIARIVQ